MDLINRNIALHKMGLTKTANFTARQNQLAQMLISLVHPARIAILDHLLEPNECITGDLVEVTGLSQAITSQDFLVRAHFGQVVSLAGA